MKTRALLVGVIGLVAVTSAHAQSVAVYRKFKGQMIVSDQPFEVTDNDKETTATLKKVNKAALQKNEDGKTWPFYFIAFLSKKPGTTGASIFFYEAGKKDMKTFKDITVDGETTVVQFELEFSEDEDGIKAGVKYDVVLGVMNGDKVVPLARTKLMFKP